MSEYSISLIQDAPTLAVIVPAWETLWHRDPGAMPFQSPHWLIEWWRAFAPGALSTVAVWRGEHLVGLAPFYIEDSARGRRLLPLGISASDYLDVLIEPACFEIVAEALVNQLTSRDSDWDVCELNELAPDANALRLPGPTNWSDAVETSQSCPVLALPKRAEELRSVVPRRKLRNIRMSWNRAARRGKAEIITAAPDQAQAFLNELIRLHQMRWESRGETGVLADGRVRSFHENAMPLMVEADLVRLYGLAIDGHMVAVYYGFLHSGRAFGYLHGFDPNYEFESPGTILIAHAIEQAIREGAREFHFLRGRESYKYGWGAEDRWNRCRTYCRAAEFADAC